MWIFRKSKLIFFCECMLLESWTCEKRKAITKNLKIIFQGRYYTILVYPSDSSDFIFLLCFNMHKWIFDSCKFATIKMKLYFVKHQFKPGTLSLTNLIFFIVEYCYIKATLFIGEGHPSPLYSEKHKTLEKENSWARVMTLNSPMNMRFSNYVM